VKNIPVRINGGFQRYPNMALPSSFANKKWVNEEKNTGRRIYLVFST
jgi:hypothetical protein